MILPSATRRSRWRTAWTQLKDLGFHWATRSGVTVSIGDVSTPADKPQILAASTRIARPRSTSSTSAA